MEFVYPVLLLYQNYPVKGHPATPLNENYLIIDFTGHFNKPVQY